MLTIGYLSFQWNGRHASMMARLLVKSPFSFFSGGIDGSSGVDQASRMKSIEVAGSEREHTAHISSSRLVTSMSSSTTTTYLPAYATERHMAARWPAWRAWPG